MIALTCVLTLFAADDTEIRDDRRGFTLRLPAGFEEYPPGFEQPDVIHSFALMRDDEPVILLISQLRGAIGRDIAVPNSIDGANTTGFDIRWKGEFDLPVVCTREEVDDASFTAMTVLVPLSPRAVGIRVAGSTSREDDMRRILTGAVESLDGPTNWLTKQERRDGLVRAVLGLVALVFAVIGAFGYYFWSRRNTSASL
jgi:hypothetical protein